MMNLSNSETANTQNFEHVEFQKKDKSSINMELKRLSQINPLRGFLPLVATWGLVAAAIAASIYFPHPLVYILTLAVIARCQHALLGIVHESAHYRLSQNRRINEAVANYFAAFPVFFCTAGYRANHMKHHKFLNTQQDPDWIRKIPLSEWQYPKTKFQLLKTGIKVALTSWYKLCLLFYYLSGVGSSATYKTTAGRVLLLQKFLFYAALTYTLAHFGLFVPFLMYWVVPFLFVFPLVERVRSVGEHFGLSYADGYTQTRNIVCSPLESFFFAPNNLGYHLVHHLYPTVPQYHLPELFKILNRDPEFKARAHNNDGYFLGGKKSVLWDLQNTHPVSQMSQGYDKIS